MNGAHLSPAWLLVLSAPLAGQAGEAPSWPCLRGPARDGVSHETGWSAAGRDEPLWSTNVGLGYSAPSIHAGRLYTQGFDEELELDRVFCLDAETGEELWQYAWPAKQRANYHTGGTLATPTIDGERVFATSRYGLLICLLAEDGGLLWERNYTEELGLADTFHGFPASALVLEDRILLVFGGTTLAVEKEGGDVSWKSEPIANEGYSNPVPFRLGERPCVAVLQGTGLFVYDWRTGERLLHHPWEPAGNGVNVCWPLVFDDRVFLSTGYDKGCTLLALDQGSEPKVLWENRSLRNKVSGCTLYEGHIYGFDESMLKCIDLAGEERWRERGLGMGALAVAGGRLLVLSSKGELIVAEASAEEFRELSRRKVLGGGEYWTSPVLVGGRIYCRNSLGDLVCLDHRGKGEER